MYVCLVPILDVVEAKGHEPAIGRELVHAAAARPLLVEAKRIHHAVKADRKELGALEHVGQLTRIAIALAATAAGARAFRVMDFNHQVMRLCRRHRQTLEFLLQLILAFQMVRIRNDAVRGAHVHTL